MTTPKNATNSDTFSIAVSRIREILKRKVRIVVTFPRPRVAINSRHFPRLETSPDNISNRVLLILGDPRTTLTAGIPEPENIKKKKKR